MCDCHFVSVICCLDVSKIGWHWLNNLDSPYHLLKMNDIMDFMDGGQNLVISSPYTRFEMWTYVFFTKKGIIRCLDFSDGNSFFISFYYETAKSQI